MGLTIHYDVKPPAHIRKAKDVLAAVEELRQRAMDLPFEECDDQLVHLLGKDCAVEPDRKTDKDDPTRWLKIQASECIAVADDSPTDCHVVPSEIVAFGCWPGAGCEALNIGCCRYPQTISMNGKTYPTHLHGWRWKSFCKTQYAANIGVKHFLHCHNLVCVLLDVAKELDFRVTVKDEGKFYQDRDLEALATEVGEWNTMIAGLAGQLKDAFGAESIESPITDHPGYERLEAQSTVDARRLIAFLSSASKAEIRAHQKHHPEQW